MEAQIREYADALFLRAVSQARDARDKELMAKKQEMAWRGLRSSGITNSETIRINAEFVGKQMLARLNSFRSAYEHASATPSLEDVDAIWKIIREVYEQGLRSIGNHLRELSKRSGVGRDPSGGLESAAAHPHDRVLNEWKVWRARVSLGANRHETLPIGKVLSAGEMPRKDDLLADLGRMRTTCQQTGLLFIDLDNFKSVNDRMGHDEGDRCLEQVAQIISAAVLHKGRPYRYASGDEFMVVLPNVEEAEAVATAERIRRSLDEENPGGAVKVTASIGVLVDVEKVYESAEEALRAADKAMYEAKLKKNSVFVAKQSG